MRMRTSSADQSRNVNPNSVGMIQSRKKTEKRNQAFNAGENGDKIRDDVLRKSGIRANRYIKKKGVLFF